MIHIDQGACLKCGRCAWDCSPGAIEMGKNCAEFKNPGNCIGCGHCAAICPAGAITMEPTLYQPQENPGNDPLLKLMQNRRSCRHFLPDPVTKEELQTIIDAARACPTAKNPQATRYIVAGSETIPLLLKDAIEALQAIGISQLETAEDPGELRRARNFIAWGEAYSDDSSFDPLFFHAGTLLLLAAPKGCENDAAGQAAYAELMAAELGLGCLYSGYFTACCSLSPSLRKRLCLKENESVVRCLVLGHHNTKYRGPAQRKNPDITFL